MSHSTLTRLIYMANQIGTFFASQGHDRAVSGVAMHIGKYWDPRMRAQIFTHVEKGGEGLDPNVKEALETMALAQKQSAQHVLGS